MASTLRPSGADGEGVRPLLISPDGGGVRHLRHRARNSRVLAMWTQEIRAGGELPDTPAPTLMRSCPTSRIWARRPMRFVSDAKRARPQLDACQTRIAFLRLRACLLPAHPAGEPVPGCADLKCLTRKTLGPGTGPQLHGPAIGRRSAPSLRGSNAPLVIPFHPTLWRPKTIPIMRA